jgi:hypothetical protein
MALQGFQKHPSDRATSPHGHTLSMVRIFRGLCMALSLLWMVFFHVGIIGSAPFRVPFRVKLLHSIITVIAVIVFILCIRGDGRVVFSVLMLLLGVWALWGYWYLRMEDMLSLLS